MEGISLILPVHNQASAIERAVKAWATTLENLKRPFEIIVINEGSTDGTADRLRTMHESGKYNLNVISHETRQGVGAALRSGFAAATKEWIATASLGYAYNPADLEKLVEAMKHKNEDTGQQVAFVNGCRADMPYVGRAKTWLDLKRYATRAMFGYLPEAPQSYSPHLPRWHKLRLRLQFGTRFQDPYSDLKLFRREVLDRIELQSTSSFLHVELLGKVNFLGHLMDEVAVARKPGPVQGNADTEADPAAFRRDRNRLFFKPQFKLGKPPEVASA